MKKASLESTIPRANNNMSKGRKIVGMEEKEGKTKNKNNNKMIEIKKKKKKIENQSLKEKTVSFQFQNLVKYQQNFCYHEDDSFDSSKFISESNYIRSQVSPT